MATGETTHDQQTSPQVVFEADYPVKTAELTSKLRGYKKAVEFLPTIHSVGFGPTYHARSSGGIDTAIRVIFLKGSDGRVQNCSLIAFGIDNQIIGFRDFTLTDDKNQYTSNGYIYTAVRAKGISTVIDSAYSDFLQRLATQYNKPIEWKIFNANAMQLGVQEQINTEIPSLDNLVAVLEKREEQDRWRAQYEVGRKFSIQGRDSRTFRPLISRSTQKPLDEDVETINKIFLTRTKGGKFEPVEVERVMASEKPSLHEENLLWFHQLIDSAPAQPLQSAHLLQRVENCYNTLHDLF